MKSCAHVSQYFPLISAILPAFRSHRTIQSRRQNNSLALYVAENRKGESLSLMITNRSRTSSARKALSSEPAGKRAFTC